jgi:hypothetical protein
MFALELEVSLKHGHPELKKFFKDFFVEAWVCSHCHVMLLLYSFGQFWNVWSAFMFTSSKRCLAVDG